MYYLIDPNQKTPSKRNSGEATGSETNAPPPKTAVTHAHIAQEFGEGFLFSREPMAVYEEGISLLSSGTRKDLMQPFRDARVTLFENEHFQKIVRLSLRIPTFDSGDREYDSWHDLFLVRTHDGILRAVYCTGGYKIAHIEGYARLYRYPDPLKEYI